MTEKSLKLTHKHEFEEKFIIQNFLPKCRNHVQKIEKTWFFDHESQTLFVESLNHDKRMILLALKIFQNFGEGEAEGGYRVVESLLEPDSSSNGGSEGDSGSQKEYKMVFRGPDHICNRTTHKVEYYFFSLKRNQALLKSFSFDPSEAPKGPKSPKKSTESIICKPQSRLILDLTAALDCQFSWTKPQDKRRPHSKFTEFEDFNQMRNIKIHKFNKKFTLIASNQREYMGLTLVDLRTKKIVKSDFIEVYTMLTKPALEQLF